MSVDMPSFGKLTTEGRTVTVTNWGEKNVKGQRNDCLWNISKNYANETLGREATNEEIQEIMSQLEVAQEGELSTQAKLDEVLNTGEQIIIPLQTQLETLTTAVTEAQTRREEAMGLLTELNDKVNSANQNVQSALSAYNALKAQDDPDSTQLSEAYESYTKALQELEDARNKAQEQNELIATIDTEIEGLNNDYNEIADEISDAESNCEKQSNELKTALENYETQKKEQETKLNNLRNTLNEANNNIGNAALAGVLVPGEDGPEKDTDGNLKFNDESSVNVNYLKSKQGNPTADISQNETPLVGASPQDDQEGVAEGWNEDDYGKYFGAGNCETKFMTDLKNEYDENYNRQFLGPEEKIERAKTEDKAMRYTDTANLLKDENALKGYIKEQYGITDENKLNAIYNKAKANMESAGISESTIDVLTEIYCMEDEEALGKFSNIPALVVQDAMLETEAQSLNLTSAETVYLLQDCPKDYSTYFGLTEERDIDYNTRYLRLDQAETSEGITQMGGSLNNINNSLGNVTTEQKEFMQLYDQFIQQLENGQITDNNAKKAKDQAEAIIQNFADPTVPISGGKFVYGNQEQLVAAMKGFMGIS